jgi:tetratricopeptide (TPR) repeat protein
MTQPETPRGARPVLRSLLTRPLRLLLVGILALAAFMLADAFYLLANRIVEALGWPFFGTGPTSLPKLYQVLLLAHTGVGLVLVTLVVVFVAWHLVRVWKRRHRSSVVSGVALIGVSITLAVTGLFILTDAASSDNRWAWWLHVGCAAAVLAGYVVHRLVSSARPSTARMRRYGVGVVVVAALLIAGHMVGVAVTGSSATTAAAEPDDAGSARFVPIGAVSPVSPFFPSAATTGSGGVIGSMLVDAQGRATPDDSLTAEVRQYGFVRDAPIGAEACVRCHQDVVAQWEASAHRFSSFNNPFYEASVDDLRGADAGNGQVKSKWCAGCHDPALLFTGRLEGPFDRGEREAQAGLTCMACHAIDRIHDQTGNGNYDLADQVQDPYLFAESTEGSVGEFLHDAVLKARPSVHKRRVLKQFFRESEFCATCHKVSLTESVNDYRWLRGQNEYDNWHDSGVSLNASRTFYLPEARRVCQDCHMPPEQATRGDLSAKDGMVRSHRFEAANTALPFVRGDQEALARVEAFLRDEKLSVDIFAVSVGDGATPVMAIERADASLVAGTPVTVEVVVRNRGVGHTFPGGTNDSNEGWLEFVVSDGRGRTVVQSGLVGPDGRLDPMAHVYKAVFVDDSGRAIHKRNAQDIRAPVFQNVIGPGSADIAHYEFVIPQTLVGHHLTIRARLRWRKFDRAFAAFAFKANPEGFTQFDEMPDLPITDIASDEVSLPVAAGADSPPATIDDPSEWTRYNDYGIGLLLEGNTRRAADAFAHVARLAPDRVDGPLNLARTALQDGNLGVAYRHLQRSEEIDPGNAQAAWVWGLVLQEDGRYEQAVAAFRRVLDIFPDDRAAWRNLGRTYYLDGRFDEALTAFDEVLRIDPEDRIAHYHRMLCYRALGRDVDAIQASRAYEYYSIDESAQELTREFRQQNPGANLMAQAIRIHRLTVEP